MVDHLWKMIRRAENEKEEYKHRLAGNLTASFGLDDDNDFFYREACLPLVNAFRQSNNGSDQLGILFRLILQQLHYFLQSYGSTINTKQILILSIFMVVFIHLLFG